MNLTKMADSFSPSNSSSSSPHSPLNDTFPRAFDDPADLDYFDEPIDEAELHTRRTVKLAFCIGYALLFLLGTLGNGLVIVMICNVLSTLSRNRRKCGSSRKLLAQASAQHVFIYVLGLSIVDLFVILHLPLLIFEMREGQWMFGEFMCKLYWFGESVNKLLSSFLMTVLSWDRYMAVCFPIKSIRMRTNSVAISVLASCTLVATLLLYPVLKESTVLRVNKLTGLRLMDEDEAAAVMDTAAEQVLRSSSHDSSSLSAEDALHMGIEQQQIVLKCVFDTSSPFFMLYTFSVGFLVPALLITFFYAQVILKLRNDALAVRKQSDGHGHNPSLSSARLHKVTKRIVAVILFYFFCWTPYWTLNIMSQFGIIIVSWSTLTLSSVFFAAHLLVCFNSAANPVLYALINRELRQQHAQAFQKRRRSLHLVANNALGFVDKKLPSPTKLKEYRLASVGCTDDTQFRLLGTNGTLGQSGMVENGCLSAEKRSSSFSYSSPTLNSRTTSTTGQAGTGLPSRLSHLRLFRHFGSSQMLQPVRSEEEETPGNVGNGIGTGQGAKRPADVGEGGEEEAELAQGAVKSEPVVQQQQATNVSMPMEGDDAFL